MQGATLQLEAGKYGVSTERCSSSLGHILTWRYQCYESPENLSLRASRRAFQVGRFASKYRMHILGSESLDPFISETLAGR